MQYLLERKQLEKSKNSIYISILMNPVYLSIQERMNEFFNSVLGCEKENNYMYIVHTGIRGRYHGQDRSK